MQAQQKIIIKHFDMRAKNMKQQDKMSHSNDENIKKPLPLPMIPIKQESKRDSNIMKPTKVEGLEIQNSPSDYNLRPKSSSNKNKSTEYKQYQTYMQQLVMKSPQQEDKAQKRNNLHSNTVYTFGV